MEYFGLEDTDDIEISKFFEFCRVHFQRSVERVKNDHALVPFGKQSRFQSLIDTLLGEDTTAEEFQQAENDLRSEFEYTCAWLDFHFMHRRGECLFPIMKKEDGVQGYGDSTNGQEGQGRWIKRRCSKRKPDMEEGLEHLFRESRLVHKEVEAKKTGISLNYGRETSPRQRAEQRKKSWQKVKRRRSSTGQQQGGKGGKRKRSQ